MPASTSPRCACGRSEPNYFVGQKHAAGVCFLAERPLSRRRRAPRFELMQRLTGYNGSEIFMGSPVAG
jgi:hypothetical protein